METNHSYQSNCLGHSWRCHVKAHYLIHLTKSSLRLSLRSPDYHPCFLEPSSHQTSQHIYHHKLVRKKSMFFHTDIATGRQTCELSQKWLLCFFINDNTFHGAWLLIVPGRVIILDPWSPPPPLKAISGISWLLLAQFQVKLALAPLH